MCEGDTPELRFYHRLFATKRSQRAIYQVPAVIFSCSVLGLPDRFSYTAFISCEPLLIAKQRKPMVALWHLVAIGVCVSWQATKRELGVYSSSSTMLAILQCKESSSFLHFFHFLEPCRTQTATEISANISRLHPQAQLT